MRDQKSKEGGDAMIEEGIANRLRAVVGKEIKQGQRPFLTPRSN